MWSQGHRDVRRLVWIIGHSIFSAVASRQLGSVSLPKQCSTIYMYMYCLGCAVLLCLVCLFDLACFFLSSLIYIAIHSSIVLILIMNNNYYFTPEVTMIIS